MYSFQILNKEKKYRQLRNSGYSLACEYSKLTYKLSVQKASIQWHSGANDINNRSDAVSVRVVPGLGWRRHDTRMFKMLICLLL